MPEAASDHLHIAGQVAIVVHAPSHAEAESFAHRGLVADGLASRLLSALRLKGRSAAIFSCSATLEQLFKLEDVLAWHLRRLLGLLYGFIVRLVEIVECLTG